MKVIELDELRKMDQTKLLEELEAAKKALFKITFEVKTAESKNTHFIGKYKKYIAQIKTLLREKELTEATNQK